MMGVDVAGTPKRSGLAVLWDVVVAPQSAFEAIRERPTWGWAFLITALIAVAGALAQSQVVEHVVTATMARETAQNPQMASLSPEKQQQIVQITLAWTHWQWVFVPIFILVAALVTSVLMFVAKAAAGGNASFTTLFALAMNVALIYWGIGYAFVSVVAAVRGPENFTSTFDVLRLWPSLAWLAPGAAPKLGAFLAGINVFSIWSCVLLAFGLETIASIKRGIAFIPAIVVVLATALSAALGAK